MMDAKFEITLVVNGGWIPILLHILNHRENVFSDLFLLDRVPLCYLFVKWVQFHQFVPIYKSATCPGKNTTNLIKVSFLRRSSSLYLVMFVKLCVDKISYFNCWLKFSGSSGDVFSLCTNCRYFDSWSFLCINKTVLLFVGAILPLTTTVASSGTYP